MSSTSLRILNRPIINLLNDHLIDYPTPVNINYLWNFELFVLGEMQSISNQNSPNIGGKSTPGFDVVVVKKVCGTGKTEINNILFRIDF